MQDYRHLQRWTEQVGARPAVQRGYMVNRVSGDPSTQLLERHDKGDFEALTRSASGDRDERA